MRIRNPALLASSTVIVMGFTSAVALGASAPPDDNTMLGEVVVTAQKRTERLIDVPMSVASATGEELASAGISSTLELQQLTPGVITTNNGLGFSPSVRGVSSAGTTPGDENNVALYLDDVYVGAPIGSFFDLQDIERVEVLKGPQGTLFGRNATGGAVRIVTRKPSFTPQGNLSVDYGFNFEDLKLGAYVTGPISDKLAGSFSASYRTGDGFVKGIGPDAGRQYAKPDNYVYRGKLLFKPTDTLQATLAADTWRNQNDIVFIAVPANGNPFPGPGSIATSPYRYAGSTQPIALVKGNSVSLDTTWDPASWINVRSITGWREVRGEYQSDIDRTSLSSNALSLKQNQTNFSQEFNISGPSDQTLTWLVGAFYYHSTAENPNWTVWGGDSPGGTRLSNFTDHVGTESYAGFGDLTWNVTSQLHLTGGARYSTETKDYHFQTLLPRPLAPVEDSHTWKSPNFRGVIRYDLAQDANVYASWSNAFKSGVYNAYSPLGIPVNPEKIKAIEVGAKARIAGITFTAAAYDYDYDNLQVQAHATINGAPVTTLTNAARAKIRGLELSANGNLVDHLAFDTGFNWMPRAKYEDYDQASVVVPCNPSIPACVNVAPQVVGATIAPYAASGSRVIKAPKWTANARLTYSTALLRGQLSATVSDSYNSGFNWQAGNLTPEAAYNVANAHVSWTDPNDRFTYSVWVTNLTNEVYSTYTTPNVRGDSLTFPEPRQFGVGISTKF